MIKRNDFSDHVEIGINIYKAKCNNETFVLKELKESETIQETLKIIKILQNIPHPNVVKFHGLINEGLMFLHNNNIIHCDMHTANILVHEGRMMIADFDFSKFSNSEGEFHGIAAFIDPCAQQFSYNDKVIFTTKYDIYALGVILWEIASCRRPFDGKTPMEIMTLTQSGVRETASEMLLEYDSLYMSCWDEDPEKRPESNSILETLNVIIEKYKHLI
ncbi:kinase-like protein [Gigaspora margarita]|uniref:Kinase-like protein n=1 Tax=Gigaspora margarita TaxID=4874 RepID=A0A8H4ET77_GIGMA|nr:kinase-like protein [Gigaspora margarita]